MQASSLKIELLILLFTLSLSGCNGSDNISIPALSSDATLADLSIAAVPIDQIFQSNQRDYTATVTLLRSTTTVTATTAHPNAALLVDEVAVDSGTASGKLTLNHGSNAISVLVTAEDGVTTNTYSIEVTRQSVASFAQRAYIKASNTGGQIIEFCCPDDPGDQFGTAIALDGDTLVVGAFEEDSGVGGINADQSDNSENGAGAVYVFVRNGSGVWGQQAYIKASFPDGDDIGGLAESRLGDDFGASIALDGDTLVIGAPGEDGGAAGLIGDESDNSALNSGAVYVFTRDNSTWSQQAYIKSPNPIGGFIEFDDVPIIKVAGEFGTYLALSGDTLVARGHLATSSTYIFARNENDEWELDAELDVLGSAFALDGNSLAIGGTASEIPSSDGSNVNVYVRESSGNWVRQAQLGPGLGLVGLVTARRLTVSLDGETLAVGAPFEDSGASGINGDAADESVQDAGAVYIFVRDDNDVWNTQAYIKASNPGELHRFGWSVSVDEDALLVGALREDSLATGVNGDQSDSDSRSGAAYLFTRDASGSWSQQAYLKQSNTGIYDQFGQSVAIDANAVAVSASWEDSNATGIDGDQSNDNAFLSGAVYVFK